MDDISFHDDKNDDDDDVLFSADVTTTVGVLIRGLSNASTKGTDRQGDSSISTGALLAGMTIIALAFTCCFCM